MSDCLVIGVDIGNGDDIGTLTVCRMHRDLAMIESINTFYGEEALWMYNQLVGKRGENKNG